MSPRIKILAALVIGVAVAAYLIQPLFEPAPERGPDTSLAEATDAGAAPRALWPVGDIPRAPVSFAWTSDPNADRYRFELRGAKGVLLHEAVVAETTLALPSGTVDWNILAGAAWRVTSLRRDGREAARAPVAFRIASP